MATFTPYMTLKVFNLASDLYDYNAVATNMTLLDQHDHSAGKGVQIGTAGIANGAITNAKLAANSVGTAQIASQAVTQTQIANQAVGTAQIAGGAITQGLLAPGLSLPTSGTAGGDLSGTYPNPTVTKIGGQTPATLATPLTGDVQGTLGSTSVAVVNRLPATQVVSSGTVISNTGGESLAANLLMNMGFVSVTTNASGNGGPVYTAHGFASTPLWIFTQLLQPEAVFENNGYATVAWSGQTALEICVITTFPNVAATVCWIAFATH